MKAIINYFKTAPMSKKLSVVVTFIWVMSVLTAQVLFALFNIDMSPVLIFVQNAFVIILSYYFIKSGAENIIGVKNTNDFINQVVEKTTTSHITVQDNTINPV